MGFNYFKKLEDKYKTRLSTKSPIVIRFDGKNICKNSEIDMLNEDTGGFAHALKLTAKLMSRKLNAIAIVASDEISIITNDPNLLKSRCSNLDCQKISSLLAQDVFYYFNKYYDDEIINFDARCFNIPSEKVDSYILYRAQAARNVYCVYYAKHILSYKERRGKNLAQLEEIINDLSPEFKNRSDYKRIGSIYNNGNEVDTSFIKNLYYPDLIISDTPKIAENTLTDIILNNIDDTDDEIIIL